MTPAIKTSQSLIKESDQQKLAEAYQNHSSLGVIYRLYCQETNISYVGQTTSIELPISRRARSKGYQLPRIKSHFNALRRQLHPCTALQQAWNQSQGKTITFEILEILPTSSKYQDHQRLRDREKYWQTLFTTASGREEKAARHYPLKAEELKTLKECGLINNTSLVYFILKLKHPWCDRPIKIRPLELAVEWDLPESSIYEAIAKLKELRLIEIEQAEIVIRWCDPPEGDSFKIPALLATPKNNGFNDPSVSNQSLSHSQQATDFWESRNDSGKSETILESQNDFWDLRNDSGKSEIKDTEALQENSSDCAYTIQTFKTPHTFLNSTGTEKISEEEKEETDQRISLESVGQIIQSKVQLLMQPTDLTKDQSSAPPPDPVEKISASLDPHPTARMEQQFQRGGQLPPWRTGSSPNDLNPEFVEWIRQWLCTIPPERDRSRGDAIAYIRKQEHTGDNAVLEARAQEWLVTAQKARDNQKQQQMMIHRVVLSEKPLLPDDQEETRANLRRINELIQQNRRQRSTQPLEPSMASPSDSSLTEAQIDCDQRDCVDLLSRISIQRRRLGWDIDQIRQWFIRTFGQTSDRLDDEQLLDAVISLEGLALT